MLDAFIVLGGVAERNGGGRFRGAGGGWNVRQSRCDAGLGVMVGFALVRRLGVMGFAGATGRARILDVVERFGSPEFRASTALPVLSRPLARHHLRHDSNSEQIHPRLVAQRLPHIGIGEVEAQQAVHGALLDLVAGFPAGDGGCGDAEARGELFLGEAEGFAVLAD